MAIVLQSKPGLSSTTTLNIPKDWDPTWFRNFISNQLKGADVRNAVGTNGIAVSGNIASPYATISFGPGPIVLNTAAGTVALTVNGATGQASAVFNNGPIQITPINGNQIVLNSSGTDYGTINNPSAQVWGLGYSSTVTGASTNALTWNTAGAVKVAGEFCCNGVATPNGADSGWGTPTGAVLTTNFPGATATLQQTSESLARIILIMRNFGFLST